MRIPSISKENAEDSATTSLFGFLSMLGFGLYDSMLCIKHNHLVLGSVRQEHGHIAQAMRAMAMAC